MRREEIFKLHPALKSSSETSCELGFVNPSSVVCYQIKGTDHIPRELLICSIIRAASS